VIIVVDVDHSAGYFAGTTLRAMEGSAHRRFTRRVSVHSGRPKGKARRSNSLPLLTYSRLGGLPQDPGRAAESSAGPRTDEDMGARRACVAIDV